MKSIRLSLIIYFLLLLAGALGAVSLLVYQITARVLHEKQDANRNLLQTQYDHMSKEVRAKTDSDLLAQARLLLNLSQSQFEANRLHALRTIWVGVLGAGASPQGHFLMPLWFAETRDFRFRVADEIRVRVANEIVLDEDLLHRSEDRSTDLYQINSMSGRTYRSGSLRNRFLPFDAGRFEQMRMLDWEFDDIEMDGVKLRRVLMKAPIVRFRSNPSPNPWPRPRGRGDRSGNTPPPPPRNPEPRIFDAPRFYIQCARDVTERNRELVRLENDLADKLRESDEDSQLVLHTLQRRMLIIGLATFAAVCLGGSLLIGFGLSPLRPAFRGRQPRLRKGFSSANGRADAAAGIGPHCRAIATNFDHVAAGV